MDYKYFFVNENNLELVFIKRMDKLIIFIIILLLNIIYDN
jgi:hypothetical protein